MSWKSRSENAIAEPGLLVRAELEQEDLAEQVRQLVGRRVGVAADLGAGVRLLEARLRRRGTGSPRRRATSPRCIRTSRMIRHARQIASVCMLRRKFGAASKPCSRIICSEYIPQPSTNSGASVTQPGQRRVAVGDGQLEVVAGIRLVDARVADRAEVVLAHRVRVVADRRRDDVDALRAAGRTSAARSRPRTG